MEGMRYACRALVENPEGKRPLVNSRHRWKKKLRGV
jgi:hypothetical protein